MSQTTYIVIGVIFLVCCISSCVGIGIYLYMNSNKQPEVQKNKPGMIGGPCLSDGTCTENNSICKFNECYEKCVPRKAFPCCTEGDISRVKTYWCDYSQCKPEGSPNDCDDIEKEKGPSAFDLASKSLADTEAKKIALREQQYAEQKAAAAKAATEAAATERSQANYCKCMMTGVHPGCYAGMFYNDGSASIPWCYTVGGTECAKAKASTVDQGLGWRLCPDSNAEGVPNPT